MGHGGARNGSGQKKGSIQQKTLDKLAMREALRRIVERDLEQLVSAQIAAANGIRVLVLRHRNTGQFVKRLTPRGAHTYLKDRAEHEVVEVWQKDPSTAAFRELMAHAIDLPKQQEQELRLTAEWRQLVAILRSARARPPQD